MKNRTIKWICKKDSGNTTSFIIGEMFMLLLVIWCTFNFRVGMINNMFNYIDDSLTSSLLGGALINVEEYGKSNQLIIHNSDVYNELDNEYNGWTKAEADILLSELNYGSEIVMNYEDLDNKSVIDLDNRSSRTTDTLNGETKWDEDYYLRRALSAFIGNMIYNTSNGRINSSVNVENIVNRVDMPSLAVKQGNLVIPKEVLDKSFLGEYIIGDIEITRLDVYNVYKANLAQEHKYKSEYFEVQADGNIVYNTMKSVVNTSDTTDYTMNTLESLDKVYKPTKINSDGSLNLKYSSEMERYNRKKLLFNRDMEVINSGAPLICYTDSKTTFQGEYNPDKIPFNRFYCKESNNDYNVIANETLVDAKVVNIGDKAPIVGYSIYSYKNRFNKDLVVGDSVEFEYIPSATFDYTHKVIKDTDTVNKITIKDGKMAGTQIENTSIYAELTFTVKTFPTMGEKFEFQWDKSEQTVTVARLIDIELNTEE